MKQLLYSFILLPIILSAQETTNTAFFRDPANYHLAAEFYVKKIPATPSDHTNYYQAACYFSLLHDNGSAFSYLKEAIIKGAKGEDVMTDTDLNPLKSDLKNWKVIDSLLQVQYTNRNPGISKPALGYELWLMGIEDQRFRTLKKNYKLPGNPVTDIKIHEVHLARLKEIITQSGWPIYSEVGTEAGDAAFFVFQHDEAKNIKPVLPLMIAAAKAGEANYTKAAMMIDRYLAYTEQVQLYGTQASRKIKLGQNRNDIPLQLYPIAEEENLLNRRNAIGMDDFLENCKRLGVDYIPIADRPGYKRIEIKKKWVAAGYIL